MAVSTGARPLPRSTSWPTQLRRDEMRSSANSGTVRPRRVAVINRPLLRNFQWLHPSRRIAFRDAPRDEVSNLDGAARGCNQVNAGCANLAARVSNREATSRVDWKTV